MKVALSSTAEQDSAERTQVITSASQEQMRRMDVEREDMLSLFKCLDADQSGDILCPTCLACSDQGVRVEDQGIRVESLNSGYCNTGRDTYPSIAQRSLL